MFPDRYHAVVIDSPRQARHALSYVINNWRKHAEDRGEVTRRWDVDWYSSGAMCPDWKERGREGFALRGPPELPPMVVGAPTTWLLREAWKKHGPISCREVPSAARQFGAGHASGPSRSPAVVDARASLGRTNHPARTLR